MADRTYFERLKKRFEEELFDNIIPFWEENSPDPDYGGYYNCLDRDGRVYDTTKHVWLQARQAWMFSKLYHQYEQRTKWLEIAESGIRFLEKNAIQENGRVYFSLDRTGNPIWIQRKIFSECFLIIAYAEYGRVTGKADYIQKARALFEKVWKWSKDLTQVGRPALDGGEETESLAIPMILLNVIEELTEGDSSSYTSEIEQCIDNIILHIDSDRELVLENVRRDGSFVNSSEGRLLNPGHAIEAGWFLHHWANHLEDPSLKKLAVNITRWSFEKGWDPEYGGLFYFLDADDFSPVQLEWFMKLWWPHTEAMYGLLLNYSVTNNERDLQAFKNVKDYAFSHFHDDIHNGWFGYLNREGVVTHKCKGAPYKGFFHVPRSLWYCLRLLDKMV